MGTAYALYNNTTVVRPWLVTGLAPQAPYVQVTGVNYRSDMYGGDTATLPGAPPLTMRVRSNHAVDQSA